MDNFKDPNYVLIVLGIVAMTTEIILGAATGFDLLIVGLIFIISGALGMSLSSFTLAMISVIILSLLYVFFGRTAIKEKLHIATIATNTDGLIGKTANVVKHIDKNTAGQVEVDGEIWRASCHLALPVGTEVVVEAISGVTLLVVQKTN